MLDLKSVGVTAAGFVGALCAPDFIRYDLPGFFLAWMLISLCLFAFVHGKKTP